MVDSCATPDKKGKLCINSLRDSQGNYLILVKSQTKDGSGNMLEDNIILE